MALVQKTRIQTSGPTEIRSSEIQQNQCKVMWVRWVRTLASGLKVIPVHTVAGSDPGAAQSPSLEPVFVSSGEVCCGSGLREQNQNQLCSRTTVWIGEQNLNHQDEDQVYQNQDPNDQEED